MKIVQSDSLDFLRNQPDESIDLFYIDPPFNTKQKWSGTKNTVSENAEFIDRFYTDDIDVKDIEFMMFEYPDLYQLIDNPFKEIIPYFLRRAQENPPVFGQAFREMSFIKQELKRRKRKN